MQPTNVYTSLFPFKFYSLFLFYILCSINLMGRQAEKFNFVVTVIRNMNCMYWICQTHKGAKNVHEQQ
jgi:hypothetical protein